MAKFSFHTNNKLKTQKSIKLNQSMQKLKAQLNKKS